MECGTCGTFFTLFYGKKKFSQKFLNFGGVGVNENLFFDVDQERLIGFSLRSRGKKTPRWGVLSVVFESIG